VLYSQMTANSFETDTWTELLESVTGVKTGQVPRCQGDAREPTYVPTSSKWFANFIRLDEHFRLQFLSNETEAFPSHSVTPDVSRGYPSLKVHFFVGSDYFQTLLFLSLHARNFRSLDLKLPHMSP
jgi:hypothetical protein